MGIAYAKVLSRLKEERMRLSLSQSEIARNIHITQSNYSKVELGTRRLNFEELKYLCQTEIDVFYIYSGIRSSNDYAAYFNKYNYIELLRCLNIICIIVSIMNYENPLWNDVLERLRNILLIGNRKKSSTIFRLLRFSMDWQQKKMAEKLGVDIKKYRDLEKGRSLPDSELLCRIYDQFLIPPAILLEDKKGLACEIAYILDMLGSDIGEKILDIITQVDKLEELRTGDI